MVQQVLHTHCCSGFYFTGYIQDVLSLHGPTQVVGKFVGDIEGKTCKHFVCFQVGILGKLVQKLVIIYKMRKQDTKKHIKSLISDSAELFPEMCDVKRAALQELHYTVLKYVLLHFFESKYHHLYFRSTEYSPKKTLEVQH